jgi:RNA polymerase sigma-70 factor (ECF subfamily)
LNNPDDSIRRTHADDLRLVRLAQAGDARAFREIVTTYEGVVAATVIGMLGPGGTADDVGQEVFVRLWRSLHRFRGDAALQTYLTRIAINLSLNELKRRKRFIDRFVSRDRSDDQSPLVEPGADGAEQADRRETARLVHAAIQRLRPEHRAVVVLRMLEGHDTNATAEILQIRPGTVMSRLSRAMRTLKPFLAGLVESSDD